MLSCVGWLLEVVELMREEVMVIYLVVLEGKWGYGMKDIERSRLGNFELFGYFSIWLGYVTPLQTG